MTSETERLTMLANCAGCAGKAGMAALAQVLEHLSDISASNPDVLVGLTAPDDAAVYRLNDDWVECEAGDYMLLRAFCPQACYAGGPEPFRYLLYKDMNRQIRLT